MRCTILILAALAGCATEASVSPSKPSAERGAVETLDPAAPRAPNAQTLYSMSKVMASRGRDPEAETVLSKILAENPEFMPAYQDLAALYLRHDRVDSAVEVLKKGVQISTQDAVMWNNLGMCRMLQSRYDEALECFTTAAAGVPKDARARANMAVALGMLGRDEESLAIYLQLVSPAEAHHNLGVLCEARKDPEGARREFALAASLGDSVAAAKSGAQQP
ncbi:MAG TPA: tetratricopeptide repeat protein [Planctomycetota bacterium]|jgi:Flp pilus assembly protein TadD|nr:tetratricopeptide repeat protein [Planctomycetota bacterium]